MAFMTFLVTLQSTVPYSNPKLHILQPLEQIIECALWIDGNIGITAVYKIILDQKYLHAKG